MIKLGITGGIGSGKSTVALLLKMMKVPVYIADDEAKKIANSSPAVKDRLIKYFGSQLYDGGQLNKKLLASLIFNNKENLKLVNSIIHPEVMSDFAIWGEKQRTPVVALESAILFESGLIPFFDKIITVTAPQEIKLERVMRREQAGREEVLKRMVNQLSDSWKEERSDFVIYNDDKRAIIPQLENVIRRIL